MTDLLELSAHLPEVELAEGYRRLVGGDFLREELPSLVAAVGGSVPQIPALLSETYREIAAKGGWLPVATGPDLKEGATGARVVALAGRHGARRRPGRASRRRVQPSTRWA